MKTGLVLEGGGMRGLYTNGVIDAMLEHNIHFDYVIGVSAGACAGVSFVSEQQKRNYRIDCDYLKDKRYVSIRNFIKTRSLFGMNFIFHEIPEKLDPFDNETFLRSSTEFITGVTEMATGKPAYFSKQNTLEEECTLLEASSSIPLFSPPVEFHGKKYLDGGTSDPIPFQKALDDGCDRLVIVRTRDRGYRKSAEQGRAIYRRAFRRLPGMVRCIDTRHLVYNHQVAASEKLEKDGTAMILAPDRPIKISRFENDMKKLDFLYRDGWSDLERRLDEINAFLSAE